MTEAEWLTTAERAEMVAFLGPRLSARKRRLFACACCRRQWHWAEGTPAAKAVEVAEAFADGRASEKKLDAARKQASAEAQRTYAEFRHTRGAEPYIAHMHASACAVAATARPAAGAATDFANVAANLAAQTFAYESTGVPDSTGGDWGDHFRAEAAEQAALLRDVAGNPFCTPAFNLDWLTGDVVLVATGIYDDRAFGQLPILADALQDAGCNRDDLLNHLRDPNTPHARGCWALDLILGYE